MKLKKLIKKLQKIEKKHGNIQVRIEDESEGLVMLTQVGTDFMPSELINEYAFDDTVPEDANTDSSYYIRVVCLS